jgi:hypothetical protein
MPTAKAMKRDASSSNPWWRTLAKWRNLTRRTSSDQELTSNGWTHLSRCVGLERRRENMMARAARRERNGCSPSSAKANANTLYVVCGPKSKKTNTIRQSLPHISHKAKPRLRLFYQLSYAFFRAEVLKYTLRAEYAGRTAIRNQT